MHKVTNTSKETQSFWAPDEQGVRRLHLLEPGASVDALIDADQPRFGKDGPFEVTKSRRTSADTEAAAKPKA